MIDAEVAIVGAGPIGLEMAVALKRAGIRYLHFDAGQIGHTISWFAPETRFFSSNERIAIAGMPLQTPDQSKATREQYLTYLRTVVLAHDLDVRTYEPVTAIERAAGGFTLQTLPRTGHRSYTVRRLILCTGGTARPRRLDIDGEDLPHVSHYLEDVHKYFRQRVLIVGGRNSAVEAALRCHHMGAKVSLSYRRNDFDSESIKYWLLPELRALMQAGRIGSYMSTMPLRITPSHVRLRRIEGGGTVDVEADRVLLLTGYVADLSLCRMAGVELRGESQVPAFDERTMQTNVPGVYVAGTVVGGTQDRYRVFIENCHVHVERILASVTGLPAPASPPTSSGARRGSAGVDPLVVEMPES